MSTAMRPTGTQIREYVQKFAPAQFAQLMEPESLFASMMIEFADRVDELAAAMTEDMTAQQTEDPLTALGSHRANLTLAQVQAWEEIVLDRFPPEVDETGAPLEETPPTN